MCERIFFFMKLVAAVRRSVGMYNDVQLGSRVFIQMPGDHVLSGTLERYGREEQYTSEKICSLRSHILIARNSLRSQE